ncbi:hypothetical protein BH11PSE2_BH11PSE2_13730 [soil metagenome]
MNPRHGPLAAALIAGLMAAIPAGAGAQISDDIVTRNKAALAAQAADPKWARKATIAEDWAYQLADGVRTREVYFYVDGGTRLHGKLYLPKGFDPKKKYPGVVVGHGINAIAIGIEKFANAFAGRGVVAMAIDYQSYGMSDSGSDELMLTEPDGTTDASTVTEREGRLVIKRTNLNNVHEVDDFRAAISYLQGEPGVDPDRIGVWATSNGGAVVASLIGVDARVKAAVIQVMSARPGPRRPVGITGPSLDDAIKRVNSGQGGETEAGFSFPTLVDRYYQQRNRDVNGGATLDQVRPTTKVLFLPAEKDELIGGNATALAGTEYLKTKGITAQTITFPGLTHFQPYAGAGFQVGSILAGDWFVKYLGQAEGR